MENYDQRVIIFFALCPLSCAIIRGVIREGIDGFGPPNRCIPGYARQEGVAPLR